VAQHLFRQSGNSGGNLLRVLLRRLEMSLQFAFRHVLRELGNWEINVIPITQLLDYEITQ
jgi:hypothetical protein